MQPRYVRVLAALSAAAWMSTAPAVAQTGRRSTHQSDQKNSGDHGPVNAASDVNVPEGRVWLGTVRLPVRLMADGAALAPGTYRVRLTGEYATKRVPGQSEQLERWVEFVQGNRVKGRAMAPVVPASAAKQVADRALPARGTVRVERLREDNLYRLWFNYRGDQVLIYLPRA
jgi:hypothetical protein